MVIAVAPGDYGKARPHLVIQSDMASETASVLVCLMTTTLRDAPAYRLMIEPGGDTGLREASQVQVDKIMALRREKIGKVVGRLPEETMAELSRRLAFMIGLGE